MSNDDRRFHLWIPQEEVDELEKKPMAISVDRGLDFSSHGNSLSQGLQEIMTAYSNLQNDSLSEEDIVVFKMVLPEGEDIYAKRDIAEKEGLKINAIKDKRHAIVSTNKSMFQRLQDRVGTYRDSGSLKHFQYVEEFEPFPTEEKQARSLKKYLAEQKDSLSVDVQMMFIPNLSDEIQDKAARRLTVKIKEMEGSLQAEPYKLSDGTTVVRAVIPIKNLEAVSCDAVIYRVEQTSFFQVSPSGLNLFGSEMGLSPDIDIDALPAVAVLDSGVNFPSDFSALVPVHWQASSCTGSGGPHGTAVASKVVFAHIGMQLAEPYLTPRTKVIDCDIYGSDTKVPSDVMTKRIEEAVSAFADVCKIFNLSTNAPRPIDGDELSIMGYHLDSLMKRYSIKFVISAGNHDLAKSSSSLEEILEDDDIRVAEPGDAMLGITVGAVAGITHNNAFSEANVITAYSRTGPGFAGFYKPDLVAYGANLCYDLTIPRDPFSIIMAPNGRLAVDCGTSFAAPVVAGDLAELLNVTPNRDVMLAQALLYNGAQHLWNTKKITQEEADYIGNHYGRGLSSPQSCKYSSQYKVSFLRSGSLKRLTKEHVKFLMPSPQAALRGNNTTRVTITCVTNPPIDKTKGSQYLGAYISASLHKLDKNGNLNVANPKVSDNRTKWDTCYHFSNTFSGFTSGDWEVWLDLSTRWGTENDVEIPYALVITIEDLTKTNDIYAAIMAEAEGRFQPITSIRIPVR
ncbi:S8 family peptidase [Dehalobacter sp. TeCB1]|uniref:S8 family peptidase n=1 Tax=Dehalobacter sp. TeCB1 TaxID=1843715 RepID=UPI00083B26A9|nr:S8 family peptidase [Dehalobacter sp. TeCB1]OCZ54236.1 hypothetical protein A7D23_05555 [Dehalobacter sp. TeCB1]